MRRFYLESKEILQGDVTLDRDQSHHIRKVLRLQAGEEISLFDGQGNSYLATLSQLGQQARATITCHQPQPLARPALHLYLGLLKGKKMELVVQKLTELGVASLQPFSSDFSEAKAPSASKLQRWQAITIEACKQCGRSSLLTIHQSRPLPQCLENSQGCSRLVCWEGEQQQGLASIEPAQQELHCFIGPEGGFSPAEVTLFQQQQLASISLGPLILRAETAAICASTLLLDRLGRLEPQTHLKY